MFKMVCGTLDELDGKLNAAHQEGYTQLFREFPCDIAVIPNAETKYYFLMMKPQPPPIFDLTNYAKQFREVIKMVGLGDRLMPESKDASVIQLIHTKKEDENKP
jgi:hypothetical protein